MNPRRDERASARPADPEAMGLVIVDHGSRRSESNRMLEQFVEMFREQQPWGLVEPAHMELAEPSIATGFARCVERGAEQVVLAPYFLAPGKHWHEDIPRLAAEAAAEHPGVSHLVTAPIGLHPLMGDLIASRVRHCLAHAAGQEAECDACAGTGQCVMHPPRERMPTS